MIILSGRKGDILTAKDTPIKHRPKIFKLLQAIHLPKEIAVIHCKGHQNKITQGNKYTDKVAKVVATSEDIFLGALIPSLPTELPTLNILKKKYNGHPNTMHQGVNRMVPVRGTPLCTLSFNNGKP